MRVPHYLRANANTELPSQMIFVDTETRPIESTPTREKHELWFGYACYVRIRQRNGREWQHEEWQYFEDTETFWDWTESVTRSGSKCYIFAHNWNFDGAILRTRTELPKRGFHTLQYINEKPPFILRVKQGKKYLALVDTLNYFTSSLEALGESIGIAKLDFPGYEQPLDVWKPYCKRDVEVLKEAVLSFREFVEREDLGNFRPTLASQAFNAFRHRFYDGNILIHTDTAALELERESYFGGRVECFRIGEIREPMWYLDVNSLYPSVMREHGYPVKLKQIQRNIDTLTLTELVDDYCVTARVDVTTDEPVYPIREDGRLIFPVGSFITTLSTPEIEYALDHNHITRVYVAAVYEKAELFTAYVDTMYAQRLFYKAQNNAAFSYLCKIMLNSLYGKFGQNGRVWQEVRDAEPSDPTEWLEQDTKGGRVTKFRVRFDKVQRLSTNGESRESFPAIAAHVTAHGRMLMWELMREAGRENVYYTDTDSLIVSSRGFDSLSARIDNARLGALAIEAEADEAKLYGPKDYIFGAMERHKGIRQGTEQLSESQWRQLMFHSWDWHQRETEDGFIYIDTVEKTLHRIYKKGTVNSDGTISPFTLTR